MEKKARNPEETKGFSKEIIRDLLPGTEACVLALYGNLGSGKTTFTQGLALFLGISERVISPTFIIEKIYKLKKTPFAHLIHIDAYRIEDPKELISLGWEDIVRDPKNIIVVEWAERIEKILPKNTTKIYFTFIDERTRTISWQ